MSIGMRKLLETMERTTLKKQTSHKELRIVPVPTSNRGKPYDLWSMDRVLRNVLLRGGENLATVVRQL